MSNDTKDLKSMMIANKELSDKARLLQLAMSDDSSTLINDLTSKDVPTQLKAFTLATAKAELIRVIKLTDALNQLEDVYIARALEDKDSMDMYSLSRTMDVIMKSLKHSTDLISRVTNDSNLNLIINQSTNIYGNSTNSNNSVQVLADKNSREKLRNISTKLLSAISNNPEQIVDARKLDAIDVEVVGDK